MKYLFFLSPILIAINMIIITQPVPTSVATINEVNYIDTMIIKKPKWCNSVSLDDDSFTFEEFPQQKEYK